MAQTARLRLDRKEGVPKYFLNTGGDFHFSPNYDPRFQQWPSDAEGALESCFTTRDLAEPFKQVPVQPSSLME